MSNLQIGLAVAGGLVLVGIVAHSAWNSRRSAPRQASPEPMPDAALRGTREPVFEDTSPGAAIARSGPLPVQVRKPAMDALIDVIATLALDPSTPAASGDAAIAAMPATRRVGTKPFAIEGYNLASLVWETPVAGQRYGGFQAGVQLANRQGPLNEIEYSEFVVKAQAFADAMNATAEFPEMRDEVARARELDQFASAHDAQLSFTLRARNASWSPGYVQQHAARLGFVAGAIAGRMVLPSEVEGAPPLLVLAFDAQAALADDPAQRAIRELNLHLDVAQVDRTEDPFARMQKAAFELASSMDGVVTDDNAQPLETPTMATIRQELQSLYDTLEARDLAAGSPLARRLFS